MTREASNPAFTDPHGFEQVKTRVGLLEYARFGLKLLKLVAGVRIPDDAAAHTKSALPATRITPGRSYCNVKAGKTWRLNNTQRAGIQFARAVFQPINDIDCRVLWCTCDRRRQEQGPKDIGDTGWHLGFNRRGHLPHTGVALDPE